jgi:carboxybiotin decarboxylase
MGTEELIRTLSDIANTMGFLHLTWKNLLMWGVSGFFIYLAIVKEYEPLLLLPIGFGIFAVNFPLVPLMGFNEEGVRHLFEIFYHYGLEWEIIPCVIFLGLGAMTDFTPLIANPRTLVIGAGAQLGVFITFIGTLLFGFTYKEAASVAIIGGADGPTTIYLTMRLAPHLLGANALAAYSYMAMVPILQPPIMKALTSKKERLIRMPKLREVGHMEKVLFPLITFGLIALLIPAVTPLMGMFMMGNLFRESKVVKRLTDTSANSLMNIATIFLGLSVGATMSGENFLSIKPMLIFGLGLIDFAICTAGGIFTVKIMNLFMKDKLNPLLGSAGVSAVPMAARVTQLVANEEDRSNFLLMQAMGPNLAGVIASAAAAGLLIAMFT